jgi:hypothetical protein
MPSSSRIGASRKIGRIPPDRRELDPAIDLSASELAQTIATGTYRSLHTPDTRPAA